MSKTKRLPFNITLMPPDRQSVAGMLEVKTLDIYNTEKDFSPQGLYSVEIFGQLGTKQRMRQFSYMDLRTVVMHPKMFTDLIRLKGLYGGIMQGKMYAVWDPVLKDFTKSDIIDGHTGYFFFMEHFKDIVHVENESDIRELRIRVINKFKGRCMYDFLLILPAGLRDIEVGDDGRTVEDDINPLYRKMLRAANTINVHGADNTTPILDTVRWSMQRGFMEIYDYIESILGGKKGFILAKYAARSTFRGTRNVVTAMDPAPVKLGAEEAITINDTVCGLYQYLKNTVEISIHGINNGPMAPIISLLPNMIPLVDPKTLKSVNVQASQKTTIDWGTDAGMEGLINAYAKPNKRHKPVYIDGHYAALIYKDDKVFKVFYDINDLPKDRSRDNVSPMTWTEMFYISVYAKSRSIAGAPSRYPILTTGSIYPTEIYVKTTTKSISLKPLSDDWVSVDGKTAICFPILDESFFESMSAHPSKIPALGLDFDGDKMSLHCAVAKEAIDETKTYLNSKDAFLNPDGSLKYGVNNPISNLVIHNFSLGLDYKWYMTVSILEEKDYDEVCLVSAAFRVESKFMGPVQKDPAFEMKRVTRYTTNDNLYIVGKVQGKIVGLIRFHNEDKITGEFGIGVLKDYQGKGYSKRLIHFLMSTLRRKGYESLKLTVNRGNATAIKLYESLNFIRQDKETEDEMQMIYYFGE